MSSVAILEATFERGSIFDIGVFGDDGINAKAYGNIFAFDSSETPEPSAETSIGGVVVGSNGDIWTYQSTFIDGSLQLGEDAAGQDGEWTETPQDGSTIVGDGPVTTDRIDPDPLGAVGGDLAEDFATYEVSNDNSLADPPIPPHNRVTLKNGQSMTLPSGNYYIKDLSLFNGSTLYIDATGGPVNIYLTGSLEAKEGSSINFAGLPTDFNLFCNSDESIILKHEGDFRGLIYAPYADVDIRNSADLLGVCWGADVEIKNSGDVFVDVAIMRDFLSDEIHILSWRELR
jgi:hypothetical protein